MDAFQLLGVSNVQKVVNAVQDIRTTSDKLVYLKRLNLVPATDGEILAKYTGRVLVADIIQDDGKAIVRGGNPINTVQTAIPNIKHGEMVTQRLLQSLDAIGRGLGTARDMGIFEDYLGNRGPQIVFGVYQRMEILAMAMMLDTFSYNRLGLQISCSWGTPSDLKVTPANLWTDAANATPVTDVQALQRVGREKYGVEHDRLDMSSTAFLNMIKTAEFQALAKTWLTVNVPTAGFPTNNIGVMKPLAANVLNIREINLDDRQVWTEAEDGSQASAVVLPVNKVILSSTALDRDDNVWDFANGVVTETYRGIVPNMIGEFPGQQEGPVGYTTAADPNGNPPGMIMWGVARGFPRKHFSAANAVLTVA